MKRRAGHVGCDELTRFVASWGIPASRPHEPAKLLHLYLAASIRGRWEPIYAACSPVLSVEEFLYGAHKTGSSPVRFNVRDRDPAVVDGLFEGAVLHPEGVASPIWRRFLAALGLPVLSDSDDANNDDDDNGGLPAPHWKLTELFHLTLCGSDAAASSILTAEWAAPIPRRIEELRRGVASFRADCIAAPPSAAEVAIVICACDYASVAGLEWANFFPSATLATAPPRSAPRDPAAYPFPEHEPLPWLIAVEWKFADDPVFRRFKTENGLRQQHVSRDVIRRFLRTPPAWHLEAQPAEIFALFGQIALYASPSVACRLPEGIALSRILRASMTPFSTAKWSTRDVVVRLLVLGHPRWRAVFSYAWGPNITLETELLRYTAEHPTLSQAVIDGLFEGSDG